MKLWFIMLTQDWKIAGKKHLLSVMYRESQIESNLDNHRPAVNIRNRDKVKPNAPYTALTKVKNSLFYGGVRLLDMLTSEVQRETTKDLRI